MVDHSEAGSSTHEEDVELVVNMQQGKGGKRRIIHLTDKKTELWQKPNKKQELWEEKSRAMGVDWLDIHTWYESQKRCLGRLKKLVYKSGSGSLKDKLKETYINEVVANELDVEGQVDTVNVNMLNGQSDRFKTGSYTAIITLKWTRHFQMATIQEIFVSDATRPYQRRLKAMCWPKETQQHTRLPKEVIDRL